MIVYFYVIKLKNRQKAKVVNGFKWKVDVVWNSKLMRCNDPSFALFQWLLIAKNSTPRKEGQTLHSFKNHYMKKYSLPSWPRGACVNLRSCFSSSRQTTVESLFVVFSNYFISEVNGRFSTMQNQSV